MVSDALHTVLRIIRILYLDVPASNSPWTALLIWAVRLATLSLILRTYVGPLAIGLISRRVRVRSVSLWSIRGIYFRKGPQTWRIQRISYLRSRGMGQWRLVVKVDGLRVDVDIPERAYEHPGRAAAAQRRKSLTLASLDPSPVAHFLWKILHQVVAAFEPVLRPLIRTTVVTCIRIAIRGLPWVADTVSLELNSVTVSFSEMPGSTLVANDIRISTSLQFTPFERPDSVESEQVTKNAGLRKSHSWKMRLMDSLARSLDRAWGASQGSATLTMKIGDVAGHVPPYFGVPDGGDPIPVFLLRKSTDVGLSVRFHPKNWTLVEHSLETSINIGECTVLVHPFQAWVKSITSLVVSRRKGASTLHLPASLHSAGFSEHEVSSNASAARTSLTFSSPLMRAISASVRLRRYRQVTSKPRRLPSFEDTSLLKVARSVRLSVALVRLSASTPLGTQLYLTTIHNLSVGLRQSDPALDPLHRRWLGRTLLSSSFDTSTYAVDFGLRSIILSQERQGVNAQLVHLGPVSLQALVVQWPAPWLSPSPFLEGDLNASLLALSFTLRHVQLTEKLDELRVFLADISATTPRKPQAVSAVRALRFEQLPRFVVEINCGPITGCLVSGLEEVSGPLALELRTNGFVMTAESSFSQERLSTIDKESESLGPVPHLNGQFHFVLEPVFVRVRPHWVPVDMRRGPPSVLELEFQEDPPLLSVEALETRGRVFGPIVTNKATAVGTPIWDIAALTYDMHISVDAVSVELWNANVVNYLHYLTSLTFSLVLTASPAHLQYRRLDALPACMCISVGIARFMVYVAGPDLNPSEPAALSRGVAMLTAIALDFSHLQAFSTRGAKDARRAEGRKRLQLPVESIADALFTPDRSEAVALFKIRTSRFMLRSAVATPYEIDDSRALDAGDTPDHKKGSLEHKQRFLRIQEATIIVTIHQQPDDRADICELSVKIPYIQGDIRLAHVYSALLAAKTFQRIKRALPSTVSYPRAPMTASSPVFSTIRVDIQVLQASCTLNERTIVTRVDGIDASLSPAEVKELACRKSVIWVSVPAQTNRWDEPGPDRWEALVELYSWKVLLPSSNTDMAATITGDGALLRIPHGYILADLIVDTIVTLKALRHIRRMVYQGRFSDAPFPTAEGPKCIPRLTFRIDRVYFELADDPFESKLGVIWRVGSGATAQRKAREEAFWAKVAKIQTVEFGQAVGPTSPESGEYQFDAQHTVSVGDARRRLDAVHMLDWALRLEQVQELQIRAEKVVAHELHATHSSRASGTGGVPNLVPVASRDTYPPLLRAKLTDLDLQIAPPTFSAVELPQFMHEQGGLPFGTKYSLLVPMHIKFTLAALNITLRDYPLPLLKIPPHRKDQPSWKFDTDIVFAEEMGTEHWVDWIECAVVDDVLSSFTIKVPKTVMPIKSYANPIIQVKSQDVTTLSWNMSYAPATHDLMRIFETLTTPARDPSPPVGFWDKMRLILHWKVRVFFTGEVRYYFKGSRDPYMTSGSGAGFVLCWQGHPEIRVGVPNDESELMQVISDVMTIAIPDLDYLAARPSDYAGPFKKVCARFCSGVRYGIGFVFERACGLECSSCSGPPSQRKCRLFSFKPHYEVKLQKKSYVPVRESPDDSYNGFRSDFMHFSFSLASCANQSPDEKRMNSLHLTPLSFAHFWSWWSLFDGALSLPIRQGRYYPRRTISPKFSRHLATIKYRINVPRLFLMHGYVDDSRESWVDGVTPWVGVKGMIDDFHADLHQREEEKMIPGPTPNTTKILRRKPFYAAEVVLKGVDLRVIFAVFPDPSKQNVAMAMPSHRSNYRKHVLLPSTPQSSPWYDLEDFIELGFHVETYPNLHILPLASCPRFAYFKRNAAKAEEDTLHISKFGVEDSHWCLLDKEPSIPAVQISLARARIAELKREDVTKGHTNEHEQVQKSVDLIEDYIAILEDTEDLTSPPNRIKHGIYHIPCDKVCPSEWAQFENVYQVHCPTVYLDIPIRDIMIQYYYSSRARRGVEYHMAARAVRFIRDQAISGLTEREVDTNGIKEGFKAPASAITKFLRAEDARIFSDASLGDEAAFPHKRDPLHGWSDGTSLRKSHYCLLLKPQILLQGDEGKEICVAAAAQAKLQSFAIMDDVNIDCPISGKVMSRNYSSVSGLQAFAPAASRISASMSIPLEVLIDLRCESQEFERLVPQTDAILHLDTFNRLRLRNRVTCMSQLPPKAPTERFNFNHLQDQTDLIRVHVPHFSVSANDMHFQAISGIIAKLLLFSDTAYKYRTEKLKTLLFTYDFTDLWSAADVIANIQMRLRTAIETEQTMGSLPRREQNETIKRRELLNLKAHIFLLMEELNMLFDAIKLAQDRIDDRTDQKSAVLLHASSQEISWQMLDETRNPLAKLVVKNINFNWLSRQDSSIVNNLTVGDLTAFDVSRHAIWAEILSKCEEPAYNPMLQNLILLADWTILPPVGGITVYESFELLMHPLRLQIDAKVGRRIMEYTWPARRLRHQTIQEPEPALTQLPLKLRKNDDLRSSLDDSSSTPDPARGHSGPSLKKLGSSKSLADLRFKSESYSRSGAQNHRTRSTDSTVALTSSPRRAEQIPLPSSCNVVAAEQKKGGDAAEMKTRSSQKTFVFVRISSLDLVLSIVKEGSFECHNAHIKTRDLVYRNQTWSFEELVNQFIPSNLTWRGWVKMVFHQPLIPVLPVAKELISKTKWTSGSKAGHHQDYSGSPHSKHVALLEDDDQVQKSSSAHIFRRKAANASEHIVGLAGGSMTGEPESLVRDDGNSSDVLAAQSHTRHRVRDLFLRGATRLPKNHIKNSPTPVQEKSKDEKGGNASFS